MNQIPPQYEVDPTNPGSVAADILSRISAYDSTAPRADADVVRRWAEVIQASRVDYEFLKQGVIRVYAAGGDPPKAKLSAVLDAARSARAESRKGESVKELGPAPSFDDDAVAAGDSGYAIEEAYTVNGAITLHCPECNAQPNQWCERAGQTLKIPHTPRLAAAYRTNHPLGKRRHVAREKHLTGHRRTYKPPWKNDTRSK